MHPNPGEHYLRMIAGMPAAAASAMPLQAFTIPQATQAPPQTVLVPVPYPSNPGGYGQQQQTNFVPFPFQYPVPTPNSGQKKRKRRRRNRRNRSPSPMSRGGGGGSEEDEDDENSRCNMSRESRTCRNHRSESTIPSSGGRKRRRRVRRRRGVEQQNQIPGALPGSAPAPAANQNQSGATVAVLDLTTSRAANQAPPPSVPIAAAAAVPLPATQSIVVVPTAPVAVAAPVAIAAPAVDAAPVAHHQTIRIGSALEQVWQALPGGNILEALGYTPGNMPFNPILATNRFGPDDRSETRQYANRVLCETSQIQRRWCEDVLRGFLVRFPMPQDLTSSFGEDLPGDDFKHIVFITRNTREFGRWRRRALAILERIMDTPLGGLIECREVMESADMKKHARFVTHFCMGHPDRNVREVAPILLRRMKEQDEGVYRILKAPMTEEFMTPLTYSTCFKAWDNFVLRAGIRNFQRDNLRDEPPEQFGAFRRGLNRGNSQEGSQGDGRGESQEGREGFGEREGESFDHAAGGGGGRDRSSGRNNRTGEFLRRFDEEQANQQSQHEPVRGDEGRMGQAPNHGPSSLTVPASNGNPPVAGNLSTPAANMGHNQPVAVANPNQTAPVSNGVAESIPSASVRHHAADPNHPVAAAANVNPNPLAPSPGPTPPAPAQSTPANPAPARQTNVEARAASPEQLQSTSQAPPSVAGNTVTTMLAAPAENAVDNANVSTALAAPVPAVSGE